MLLLYSIVRTAIVHGIESVPVYVEADVSDGLPMFEMVGFLSAEVREAKERVRTALRNLGYTLPARRITINLYPAYVKKSGSSYDLPIAVAVLAAMGVIRAELLDRLLIIGEIGLNGDIQPIHGVLPLVAQAREQGIERCMVPLGNETEARLAEQIRILPVAHLRNVIHILNTGCFENREEKIVPKEPEEKSCLDFSDIHGQHFVKRACEVAVSGMHHMLMIGPPGAGKTMVAKRIPSILPALTREEQLELSKIYSVCGLLDNRNALLTERPFRCPHHTISPQGLSGGGGVPKPGEISLAHKGVLFLDELTEFRHETLEILRQPLEEHQIRLVRISGAYTFPADFMLVCAMNPCSCGYYPDRERCNCSPAMLERYKKRISRPLLDRIDICVEARQMEYRELTDGRKQEQSSEMIRERVAIAQERQRHRFRGTDLCYNSRIPAPDLEKYCGLTEKEKKYMEQIYTKMGLTARTYHKILKVARTLADMEDQTDIGMNHLSEAICYRSADLQYREGTL